MFKNYKDIDMAEIVKIPPNNWSLVSPPLRCGSSCCSFLFSCSAPGEMGVPSPAVSQSWDTLSQWYLIRFSFFNRFHQCLLSPHLPIAGEFLEGKHNVTAFFPTCLQLPVAVLGTQWAVHKHHCSPFNTQATPASPLTQTLEK